MLLVHLVLSIVTETRCSRIPEPQEEKICVSGTFCTHRNTITVCMSTHIATALERLFVRCSKKFRSDVVGESGVPEVSLVQCLRWTSR